MAYGDNRVEWWPAKGDRPDGILLTMPKVFFEHYPEATYRRVMETLEERGEIWYNKIAAIPKIEVLWCYLVFGDRIQYRANIAGYERNQVKEFTNPNGIEVHYGPCNWVLLCPPIIKAPFIIDKKGFQGFRYCRELF